MSLGKLLTSTANVSRDWTALASSRTAFLRLQRGAWLGNADHHVHQHSIIPVIFLRRDTKVALDLSTYLLRFAVSLTASTR